MSNEVFSAVEEGLMQVKVSGLMQVKVSGLRQV